MPQVNYKTFLLGIVLVSALVLGIYNLLKPDPKVGYVSNVDIYNEFALKKQLEQKLNQAQKVQKEFLDSIYLSIQTTGKSANSSDNVGYYYSKKKEFDEANHALSEEYNKQIWDRLNQYIEEFGRANKYTMIMGATGNGSLMYGDSSHDVTNEIKGYIESRYKGEAL